MPKPSDPDRTPEGQAILAAMDRRESAWNRLTRRCQAPPDLLGAPACQAEATHVLWIDAQGASRPVATTRPQYAHYCLTHARQLAGQEGVLTMRAALHAAWETALALTEGAPDA